MSIQFSNPMNEATAAKLRELFQNDLAAMDEKMALVNRNQFDSLDMMDIIRTAKQPLELNIHGVGEIKILSDGTQYQLTPKGWQKITPQKCKGMKKD